MSEKVIFEPNTPVQVALKYTDGKEVEGRFGNQMFYSLLDGRGMYLNMDVAAKINMLGPRKGEPFMICQRWSGKKGEQRQWDVWRPDVEQQLRASIRQVEARKDPTALLGPDPPDPPERASVSARTPTPASPIAEATNGHSNGTNGHSNGVGRFNPPPTKIPMDRAVVEAVRMVQAAMKETGEQWSDGARQDLVSTVLIAARQEGWLCCWNRGVE